MTATLTREERGTCSVCGDHAVVCAKAHDDMVREYERVLIDKHRLLADLERAEAERDALRVLAREALLFGSTNGMHPGFWNAVDLVGGADVVRQWPFYGAYAARTGDADE